MAHRDVLIDGVIEDDVAGEILTELDDGRLRASDGALPPGLLDRRRMGRRAAPVVLAAGALVSGIMVWRARRRLRRSSRQRP